ncbi:MAG: glycosyltransferase family 39 protein [Acidobacteriota bacterium]
MRPLWANVFRWAALSSLVIAIQWSSGAYQSETGGSPDEAAHIVSGLMMRDYFSSGWGRGPIEFAADYYLHYPKVAVGHWPPVFYLEQAVWTRVFPTSRASLLVMMALQGGLLAALLWPFLRARYGSLSAWLGILVLLTLPGLAPLGGMIMTEIPIAVLILLAMFSWSRFLESGRAWPAIAFGLLSAAAILTKGTGAVLAGVPLLSVALAGSPKRLRSVWFWIPALIVVVTCGPWYLLAPGAMHERVAAYGGLGLATSRFNFPLGWADEFGWVIAVLALAGLTILLYRRVMGSAVDDLMVSAAALGVTATVFPMLVGAWEPRHLVEVAPAFLLLAAVGVGWIASWPLPNLSARASSAVLVLVAVGTIAWNVSFLRRQEPLGYRQLSARIVASPLGPARTILISGDSVAEGALISETALREPHPARYIVRGTKLFADIEWMGKVKNLRVTSAAEVQALLSSLPFDLIVVDRSAPAPYAYQSQLLQALAEHPEYWRDADGGDPRFSIFRRVAEGPEISSSQIEASLKAVLAPPVP